VAEPRLVVRRGADFTLQDRLGRTAQQWASQEGQTDCSHVLQVR
jgi:ankyrin repeat protein